LSVWKTALSGSNNRSSRPSVSTRPTACGWPVLSPVARARPCCSPTASDKPGKDGQSARNPAERPYEAGQFVADLVAASSVLQPLPVLVGASMGGLTGLLAQARNQPFSALVLVDVTPRWEAAGAQRIHSFMSAFPDGFDSLDHAADVIAYYLPHRRLRKTPAQLQHLLRIGPGERLQWHWDPRLLSEFFTDSQLVQDLVTAAAREIDVPVLLISGGRSDLVSDDTVGHFLEMVPHAQHVRLPEATHMLAGDNNDTFTDTLLSFLRAQFPSSPLTERTAPGVPR
jgi:pimeloyl-ACP methyl ester carboxylesterase